MGRPGPHAAAKRRRESEKRAKREAKQKRRAEREEQQAQPRAADKDEPTRTEDA